MKRIAPMRILPVRMRQSNAGPAGFAHEFVHEMAAKYPEYALEIPLLCKVRDHAAMVCGPITIRFRPMDFAARSA